MTKNKQSMFGTSKSAKYGRCKICGRKMEASNDSIGPVCKRKLLKNIKINGGKTKTPSIDMFENLEEECD